MLKSIEGNLLNVESGLICHQVNCQGAFGAGIAGQIAHRWPEAKRVYERDLQRFRMLRVLPLGQISHLEVKPRLHVVHLFGQNSYGNASKTGRIYTDYAALELALNRARIQFGWGVELFVPHGLGCGLAGGDWSIVSQILSSVDATVVKLPSQ